MVPNGEREPALQFSPKRKGRQMEAASEESQTPIQITSRLEKRKDTRYLGEGRKHIALSKVLLLETALSVTL